ncbi:MAG TPA: 50S ribosomal protein L18, partial [Candidatus Berkiella sp.]|nr:50S ribosomal protein L18 [Candidatus Berkiella sp.]
KQVGKLLAERAKEAGVHAAASDRSGFKFHGRVAALIQSANEHGLTV